MDGPYARELAVAISAIQHAVKISSRVIASKNKGIVEKDDHSPVTVADLAIQALLTATIHSAFPDDLFVGEESAEQLRASPTLLDAVWGLLSDLDIADSVARIPASKDKLCSMLDWAGTGQPSAGRYWIFDPIDGTKAFIRGENYAVNVCLMTGPGQTLSAVGIPLLAPDAVAPINNDTTSASGSIMFATRGHGTFIRPLDGPADTPARRLPRRTADDTTQLTAVTCVEGTDSAVPGLNVKIAARLGIAYPGNDLLAWVLRWAVLGLGAADATFWVYRKRTRYGKIWDHAGAMLLFEEAGGKITDVHGKVIDIFAGRAMSSNFGFVAALEGAHARVLSAVQDAVREEGLLELLV
ncbi:3'(2'),5'-bisphosphate nucleotidase [Vanrija pseudolonga]|uniref:3'(2'),5'-bisphosphate nucleotidase n=1 Tax=Vanrija pseudolonga TaxID=143232 RepID=A0AAF0Y7Z3_9TREE|nr:3'(2'),5'-bisphosphate nucleotidase [Vanrija pseudolonga]